MSRQIESCKSPGRLVQDCSLPDPRHPISPRLLFRLGHQIPRRAFGHQSQRIDHPLARLAQHAAVNEPQLPHAP